jgi:sugar phosphate isomerase/epimerase
MAVFLGAGAGSSIALLEAELARLVALGYSAAEINPDYLECIFGGRLHAGQQARIEAACQPRALAPGAAPQPGKLRLTVHAPAVLDLRHATLPDVHRDILMATVEVASAAGAAVVVVHFEQHSGVAAVEEQLRRGIELAADLAGRRGVTLGVENIEVERAERVLELLDRLDHPHVRMTYDFGHDFLAAAHFGYDHLASVRACAPYVAHTHLSDNFGRFDPARLGDFTLYKAVPARNIQTAGIGDVHLPIGWGALPYDVAIRVFREARDTPYEGVLLGEHRRSFADADAEVLERLREFAEVAGSHTA